MATNHLVKRACDAALTQLPDGFGLIIIVVPPAPEGASTTVEFASSFGLNTTADCLETMLEKVREME